MLAVWIGDGALGTCGQTVLETVFVVCFQCIFSASNSTLVGLLQYVLKHVGFTDLNLVFMGMWAMPVMSSEFRHTFGCIPVCVYIYIYDVVQLILALQVAVVCSVLCCFFVWFLVLGLNELNLLSPITMTYEL